MEKVSNQTFVTTRNIMVVAGNETYRRQEPTLLHPEGAAADSSQWHVKWRSFVFGRHSVECLVPQLEFGNFWERS